MALVKINGRTQHFDAAHIEIIKTGSGRFTVKAWTSFTADPKTEEEDYSFEVLGGRASGGASNEWFTHRPEMFGEQWVPAKSMKEAIERGVCY